MDSQRSTVVGLGVFFGWRHQNQSAQAEWSDTPTRCEGVNPSGGMAQLVAHLLCKQRLGVRVPYPSVVLGQHS